MNRVHQQRALREIGALRDPGPGLRIRDNGTKKSGKQERYMPARNPETGSNGH
jgi:hypothetical protein